MRQSFGTERVRLATMGSGSACQALHPFGVVLENRCRASGVLPSICNGGVRITKPHPIETHEIRQTVTHGIPSTLFTFHASGLHVLRVDGDRVSVHVFRESLLSTAQRDPHRLR